MKWTMYMRLCVFCVCVCIHMEIILIDDRIPISIDIQCKGYSQYLRANSENATELLTSNTQIANRYINRSLSWLISIHNNYKSLRFSFSWHFLSFSLIIIINHSKYKLFFSLFSAFFFFLFIKIYLFFV